MTTPENDVPSTHHTEREREVIVTDSGSRSYGGLIVAVLAIIVFGVLGYMALSAMDGDGDGGMSVPEEVDVNVDTGGGGEG